MSWASHYIEQLGRGETVTFRPRGNSMSPRLMSGEECTVIPVPPGTVHVGDVVLCKVNGQVYLHLVKAIGSDGRYQIGNMRGHVNGWASQVYGKVGSKVKEVGVCELSDPAFTLGEWNKRIQKLIDQYGENAVLSLDAGYNNIWATVKHEEV